MLFGRKSRRDDPVEAEARRIALERLAQYGADAVRVDAPAADVPETEAPRKRPARDRRAVAQRLRRSRGE